MIYLVFFHGFCLTTSGMVLNVLFPSILILASFHLPSGIDEAMKDCRIGITAKNKLHKVIEWLQRAGLASHDVELNSDQVFLQFFYCTIAFGLWWK